MQVDAIDVARGDLKLTHRRCAGRREVERVRRTRGQQSGGVLDQVEIAVQEIAACHEMPFVRHDTEIFERHAGVRPDACRAADRHPHGDALR